MSDSNPLSRRSFLQVFLNGLGGCSMAALVLPLHPPAAPAAKTGELDLASFSNHLNSKFRAFYDGYHSVKMTLSAVKDLRTSPNQQGEVFSLLLEAPGAQTLPQGTYVFRHAELGDFDMFIVPGGSDEISSRYTALFNRLEPV